MPINKPNLLTRVKENTLIFFNIIITGYIRWTWGAKNAALMLLICASPFIAFEVVDQIFKSHSTSEKAAKATSVALQCAGILILIAELSSIRLRFSLPSEIERVRLWWRRRPKWPRTVTGQGGGAAFSINGTGRGITWHNREVGQEISRQLDVLERNIETLRSEMNRISTEVDSASSRFENKLLAEEDARRKSIEDLRCLIEFSATSGLRVTLAGAIFALEGAVLASFPELVGKVMQQF